MLDQITPATALQQLHTRFRLHLGESEAYELELISVTEKGRTPRQEQFALLFRGPLERFLPQQMYRMEHEHFGSLELFLVPVAREQDGYSYEAYFNRLIPEAT